MPTPPSSGARTKPHGTAGHIYLLSYNLLSFTIWSVLLARTCSHILSSHQPPTIHSHLSRLLLTIQSLAALEVLHAATGLVRASPSNTALQVGGRNVILWCICANYPGVAAQSWAYVGLLLCWATAEVVRYGYFAWEKGLGGVPGWLRWVRYNMFMVLYPPGILSEMWLVYRVIEPSKARQWYYQYLLWFGLAMYAPASYELFAHMSSQRRKALLPQREKSQ